MINYLVFILLKNLCLIGGELTKLCFLPYTSEERKTEKRLLGRRGLV